MTADSEAPMPPVFMHSSTMMTLRVLRTLLVMVSMSNGFRLMRSMTYNAATDDLMQLMQLASPWRRSQKAPQHAAHDAAMRCLGDLL